MLLEWTGISSNLGAIDQVMFSIFRQSGPGFNRGCITSTIMIVSVIVKLSYSCIEIFAHLLPTIDIIYKKVKCSSVQNVSS